MFAQWVSEKTAHQHIIGYFSALQWCEYRGQCLPNQLLWLCTEFGERVFCHSGPAVSSSLLHKLRSAWTVTTYTRHQLKAHFLLELLDWQFNALLFKFCVTGALQVPVDGGDDDDGFDHARTELSDWRHRIPCSATSLTFLQRKLITEWPHQPRLHWSLVLSNIFICPAITFGI